jgi:hypothetical protein
VTPVNANIRLAAIPATVTDLVERLFVRCMVILLIAREPKGDGTASGRGRTIHNYYEWQRIGGCRSTLRDLTSSDTDQPTTNRDLRYCSRNMGRQAVVVLYVAAMTAVIVGVDVVFFRDRFWERLAVNVGIVLVFGAFY